METLLTDFDIRHAQHMWKKPPLMVFADRRLAHGETLSIRQAREGLLLSQTEVARRMGVTLRTYELFEKNEANGAIDWPQLQLAAAALDLEIIFQVRPARGETFTQRIWQVLLAECRDSPFLQRCHPKRRGLALASMANRYQASPVFRRKVGWTQRWSQKPGHDLQRRSEWARARLPPKLRPPRQSAQRNC
jgi:transcriptional regulator with XRE-family HTH domain